MVGGASGKALLVSFPDPYWRRLFFPPSGNLAGARLHESLPPIPSTTATTSLSLPPLWPLSPGWSCLPSWPRIPPCVRVPSPRSCCRGIRNSSPDREVCQPARPYGGPGLLRSVALPSTSNGGLYTRRNPVLPCWNHAVRAGRHLIIVDHQRNKSCHTEPQPTICMPKRRSVWWTLCAWPTKRLIATLRNYVVDP